MRIAVYLAIFIWFLRKTLERIRGKSRSFRGSIRKRPGQPGYDPLFLDNVVPVGLGMSLTVEALHENAMLYYIDGPYMLCPRDIFKIMDDKRWPKYRRHVNGLHMQLSLMHCGLLDSQLKYDEVMGSLKECPWLYGEVKEFSDTGREYMKTLFRQ